MALQWSTAIPLLSTIKQNPAFMRLIDILRFTSTFIQFWVDQFQRWQHLYNNTWVLCRQGKLIDVSSVCSNNGCLFAVRNDYLNTLNIKTSIVFQTYLLMHANPISIMTIEISTANERIAPIATSESGIVTRWLHCYNPTSWIWTTYANIVYFNFTVSSFLYFYVQSRFNILCDNGSDYLFFSHVSFMEKLTIIL